MGSTTPSVWDALLEDENAAATVHLSLRAQSPCFRYVAYSQAMMRIHLVVLHERVSHCVAKKEGRSCGLPNQVRAVRVEIRVDDPAPYNQGSAKDPCHVKSGLIFIHSATAPTTSATCRLSEHAIFCMPCRVSGEYLRSTQSLTSRLPERWRIERRPSTRTIRFLCLGSLLD